MVKQIRITGDIEKLEAAKPCPLFGEVAQKRAKVKEKKVKSSTLNDYRSATNICFPARLGNVSIDKIRYGDVEVFISELKCSAKRINHILVPMRALMKFAFKDGLIEKNPMALVENLKVVRPSINPLSMDEVQNSWLRSGRSTSRSSSLRFLPGCASAKWPGSSGRTWTSNSAS